MTASDLTAIADFLEELNMTMNESFCLPNSSECVSWEIFHCPYAFDKNAILYTMSFFYALIFIVGLVANVVVVYVNLKTKRTQYETHLYILNLAIADLCMVATLPIWLPSLVQHGSWPFGEFMCRLTHLVFSVNLFGSIFFLTCMSVDRYISVVRVGESVDRRKGVIRKIIIVYVWIFALVVSFPDILFLKTVTLPSNGETYCYPSYPEENFRKWMAGMEMVYIIIGFVIPFPIITVSYFLLARAISSTSDQENKNSRNIIFVYVIIFLICWLPYHTVLFIDVLWFMNLISFSCELESFMYISLHLTQCFSMVHCCANPILYSFINKNYRYRLMNAFTVKYTAKTSITKLKETTETECSLVEAVSEMTAFE
ncbi:atypical chemokine receptor 3 [Callorhinchus milii]|uniref:Atypical chemokine receptor 3b n=1 Tax=Callorhinchus milii TaxID=7868 RepID=A0A4W3IYK8_CALMI|nr:atypical chemokine receptor 3 [Callorhinchus milii]|eukprot:gi/632975154/ref/XP_007904069.1/ PREDICTED: atypical chemokine receptor 3 [Callorhinchus milii]